jgi:hypothetical protein
MQKQLMRIADRLRDSGMITGRVFATILVSSTSYTIWPMYLWLRTTWGEINLPLAYAWMVSAAYFSFWVWLVVLLTRNGKQYRGMIWDAICGGSLLTVAVALHQPPVRTALAQTGFGAAAWVVFLCASALVLARSVQSREATVAMKSGPADSGSTWLRSS